MLFEITLLGLAYYASKKMKEDGPITKTVREFSGTVKSIFKSTPPPRARRTEATQPQVGEEMPTAEEIHKHYKEITVVSIAAMVVDKFLPLAGPLGFVSYVYVLAPHLRTVEETLRKNRRIDVHSLFLFADILALLTGSYIAAAFSLYLMEAGKLAVIRAKDTSRKHLQHLFTDLPSKVWIIHNGTEIEVPLATIQQGDIVVLHGGKVIPVDGIITEGMAGVDQQALTGESQLADKGPGDRVFANTILINGRILVQVERSGPETTANQIADILLKSVDYKSPLQLKGERWADKLTGPMFYSSLVLLPLIGPVPTSVFINAHIGMRIRILAPMNTLKHISIASRKGLLVKDGRALEKFLEIDAILFDKTGTLTYGDPKVAAVISSDSHSIEEIVRYAAIAEQKLTHPIAKAILDKALELGISYPDIKDSHYSIGYGIKVDCSGETIQAGSLRYLEGEDVRVSEKWRQLWDNEQFTDRSLIFLAVNREVIGALQFQPRVRMDLGEVIAKLRKQGIKYMAIVSGDGEAPTRLLSEQLGMDDYYAKVLPQEKADIVTRLQAKGKKVCFIGDGINDSIALKQADVSISLAGASTIAKDMAEIVLMDGHIGSINDLHDISKALDKSLKQSLALSIAPGMINLFGAFVLSFNTLTSLMVNASFGFFGASLARPSKNEVLHYSLLREGGGRTTQNFNSAASESRKQGTEEEIRHGIDHK